MKVLQSPLLSQYHELEHQFTTKKAQTDEQGFPMLSGERYYLKQVHKDRLISIKEKTQKEQWIQLGEADGVMTHETDIWLCIKTADCLPVILYDPTKQAVACIHSGWRSTLENIVGKGIKQMGMDYGCQPKDIVMSVGPSICYDCFEVGGEVIEMFQEQDEAFFEYRTSPKDENKYVMDLKSIVKRQAMTQNLEESNIEIMPHCTYEDEDAFYSYRRSSEPSRLWTNVKLRPTQ